MKQPHQMVYDEQGDRCVCDVCLGVAPWPLLETDDDSEYHHAKGRSCARTDEVLENYRLRAIRAERENKRLRAVMEPK